MDCPRHSACTAPLAKLQTTSNHCGSMSKSTKDTHTRFPEASYCSRQKYRSAVAPRDDLAMSILQYQLDRKLRFS